MAEANITMTVQHDTLTLLARSTQHLYERFGVTPRFQDVLNVLEEEFAEFKQAAQILNGSRVEAWAGGEQQNIDNVAVVDTQGAGHLRRCRSPAEPPGQFSTLRRQHRGQFKRHCLGRGGSHPLMLFLPVSFCHGP